MAPLTRRAYLLHMTSSISPDEETLVARVAAQAGPIGDRETRRAIEVTLRGLGSACPPALRHVLAEPLPRRLGRVLEEADTERSIAEPDALCADVARELGLTLAEGMERAKSVGAVLGELLDVEAHARVRASLGSAWAAFLAPREVHALHRTKVTPERTLAGGRPGPERSVAATPLPLAQTGSVDFPDAHPDRLAAAHPGGDTSTLAAGRPGSRRPLGER